MKTLSENMQTFLPLAAVFVTGLLGYGTLRADVATLKDTALQHEQAINKLVPLVERIDERTAAIQKQLDKMEQRLNGK